MLARWWQLICLPENFLHEYTNMLVVPTTPDSCGVFRFYLCNILVVSLVTVLSVDNIVGLRPLQHSPGGGGAPQSWCLFYTCNPPAELGLQISDVFHFYAYVAIPTSKSYPPMVIEPLAQCTKLPSMPCFTMVLDTLEISPPFIINALLRHSIRHRWDNSFILFNSFILSFPPPILNILNTTTFFNFLTFPPSITIGLCRPLFTLFLFYYIFYSDFFGTRRHLYS